MINFNIRCNFFYNLLRTSALFNQILIINVLKKLISL